MVDVAEKIRNSGALALALKYFSRAHVAVYQRTNGKLGAQLLWFPAALLTTTGRKSGESRTTATLCLRDGERVVLPASFGGRDGNPAWYLNLLANPEVRVAVAGRPAVPMRARTMTDAERSEHWPAVTARYRNYANYQTRTDRVIPLVLLEPVTGAA